MHEYKQKLDVIAAEVDHALTRVNLDGLKKRVAELEKEMLAPDFWQNQDNAQKVNKELSDLQKEIAQWEKIKKDCDGLVDLFPDIHIEEDPEGAAEFKAMVDQLEKDWHKLEIKTFLNGKYDKNNIIMSIHAGTGGKDAADWAEMLMRMYMRWAEKNSYEVEIFEKSVGEEVGLKSATLLVKGYLAYGYLKGERGVHRLVRLSPFNAKHTRETSFAFVDILPEIPDEEVPDINPSDLKIDTYRSGGAGGQNVNKVSSAVRVTHLPTGVVVACQDERSQLHNKERAMKILHAKLADMLQKQKVEEIGKLRGERIEIAWGNQIRSYVLHPYTMVKDHRTDYEEHAVDKVLDGEIDGFIEAELKGVKKD